MSLGLEEKINDIYQRRIENEFYDLEEKRKEYFKQKKRKGYLGLIIIVSFLSGLFFLARENIIMIILAAFVLIVCLAITNKINPYKDKLEREIKVKLINVLNDELNIDNIIYNPDAFIVEEAFLESNLYQTKNIFAYSGEDFLEGKIDNISLQVSELEVKGKNDKSNRKEDYYNVFSGTFIKLDFNKEIKTNVILQFDIAEKLFGFLGSKIQKSRIGYEIVKLENPKFEKIFKVQAQSQQEARYILTPALMERLIQVNKKMTQAFMINPEIKVIGKYNEDECFIPMYVSFIKNKMYIAVPSLNIFPININEKYGVNRETIEDYIMFFNLFGDLVEDLRLNRDIWV